MTIKLSDLGGDSGVFIPTFTSGYQLIPIGSSGDILILTPPAGEAVRLVTLATTGGPVDTGISVRISGIDAVTNKTLAGSTSNLVDYFLIATGPAGNHSVSEAAAIFPSMSGLADEIITVVKLAGSTGVGIVYGYQFGVIR